MKYIISLLLVSFLLTSCEYRVKINDNYTQESSDTTDYSVIPEKTILLEGFELPSLGFAYNALEPNIDAKTVYIHYNKHTRGYYTKFVNAIQDTETTGIPLTDIIKNISQYDAFIVKNAGQYFNHVFYWENLSPDGGQPSGELLEAINQQFGSFDEFKKEFSSMAKSQFGSGWAWLAVDKNGALFVSQTPNEVNPLMDIAEFQGTPLLTVDVWEHAYYLKYQNLRGDYIENFFNVINWNKVNERYERVIHGN